MAVVAVTRTSRPGQDPSLIGGDRADYSPTTTTVRKPQQDLAEVGVLLSTTQPVVITVVGDTTSNDEYEWVHLLAGRIATRFGRSVTVRDWVTEERRYELGRSYGPRGRAVVTIWNGAASGKDPGYSATHWKTLSPEGADLFLINHGHNKSNPYSLESGVVNLVGLAAKQSPVAFIGVVLQNPRFDSPSRASSQAKGVDLLRQYVSSPINQSGASTIDVFGAFSAAGPGAVDLIDADGFHPNARGQRVWADAVAESLGVP
ncbi:SGNH/GDSL hydrolase family protein [Gordonia alkanivorans]|uniref:SGNH/GDSL hydrolase family protein n=1 Tax=Gordonia alkanivorans TaxID=84096 RepID=UPI00244A9930|nr:SGNH/GDSL hydrolase family protein [Gordonia alkanivorans]MDH3022466.1 SGNH/GDSL hydrolase family protein [Gordonia alkanivorans]